MAHEANITSMVLCKGPTSHTGIQRVEIRGVGKDKSGKQNYDKAGSVIFDVVFEYI